MGWIMQTKQSEITVIILTYNEQLNLLFALNSVQGWAHRVYVVDSFSTDETVQIARCQHIEVYQHPFADWAAQRNWALDTIPLDTEWIFFLDADEQLTDALKKEIQIALDKVALHTAAFTIRQAFVFMGRHLKHAHDGPPLVRLARKNRVRWICEGAREYCKVDGAIGTLKNPLWHDDHKGLTAWTEKQNGNATREAWLLWQHHLKPGSVNLAEGISERELRFRIRKLVWRRLPLFARSVLYFLYRYLLRGGFLDGKAGLIYSILHAFWYQFLIDAKYYELMTTNHKHVDLFS